VESEKTRLVSTVQELESLLQQMEKEVRLREEQMQMLSRDKSALEEELHHVREELMSRRSINMDSTPQMEENMGSVMELFFQEKIQTAEVCFNLSLGHKKLFILCHASYLMSH
jgi:hypothetical protein